MLNVLFVYFSTDVKGQEKEVDDPLLNVAGLKDSSLDEVMLNNKLLTYSIPTI